MSTASRLILSSHTVGTVELYVWAQLLPEVPVDGACQRYADMHAPLPQCGHCKDSSWQMRSEIRCSFHYWSSLPNLLRFPMHPTPESSNPYRNTAHRQIEITHPRLYYAPLLVIRNSEIKEGSCYLQRYDVLTMLAILRVASARSDTWTLLPHPLARP